MARFDISKQITKEFEGGFWNDPSAGWTYKGITQKFYPSWPGFARLEQLRRKKYGNGQIPRYTIFNDVILDKLVDEFYHTNFWKSVIYGDYIQNQDVANMVYDFVLHKQNAAIKIINKTARAINVFTPIKSASITREVIAVMNKQPKRFYSLLRAYRIDYYNKSNSFSKEMKEAFVDRVKKLPAAIAGYNTIGLSN